jgi:hypothetical protein
MNERQRVLEALRNGRSQLETAVKAVPTEAWSQGVYENGWNAKQLLCHLSGGTPAGFILGMASRTEGEGQGAGTSGFDIDAWNKEQVESKESKSINDLLEDARAGFAKDEAQVKQTPDDLLAKHYKAPWGVEGSVADVIIGSINGHLAGHLGDLRSATQV